MSINSSYSFRSAINGLTQNVDRVWRMLNPLSYKTSIDAADEFILKDSTDYKTHKLITGYTLANMLGTTPSYWSRSEGVVYPTGVGDDIRLTGDGKIQFLGSNTEIWYDTDNLYFKDATVGTVSLNDLYLASVVHNETTGLQGGIANQYYHLTLAQRNSLHDAITIDDTSSIDLTLVGQLLKAEVIPGGVNHNLLLNTHNLTTDITHNTISGLQGGTSNEYYHLTSAQYSALHSAITIGNTGTVNLTLATQYLTAEVIPGGIAHNDLGTLQGGTANQYYHLTSSQYTALHSAVTVNDTSTINLTLNGQLISGVVISGGISHDDLADTHDLTTDIAHSLHNETIHSDVDTTSLAEDDILKWNGSDWVNVPIPSSGSGNSYTTITGDTGTAYAGAAATLNVVGGSSCIQTVVTDGSPDKIEIHLNEVEINLLKDSEAGGLIRGTAGDSWQVLSLGANNTFLKSDGTEFTWAAITLSHISDYSTYLYTKTNLSTSGQATIHWDNTSTGRPTTFTYSSGSGATGRVAYWSGTYNLAGSDTFTFTSSGLDINGSFSASWAGSFTNSNATSRGLKVAVAQSTGTTYNALEIYNDTTNPALFVHGDGSVKIPDIASPSGNYMVTVDSTGLLNSIAIPEDSLGILWDGSGSNKVGTWHSANQIHAEDTLLFDGDNLDIYSGGIYRIYTDTGTTLVSSLGSSSSGGYLSLEDITSADKLLLRGYAVDGIQAYLLAGDLVVGYTTGISGTTEDYEIWVGNSGTGLNKTSAIGIIGRTSSSNSYFGALKFHQTYSNTTTSDVSGQIAGYTGTNGSYGNLRFSVANNGTLTEQFRIDEDGSLFAYNLSSGDTTNLVFYNTTSKELTYNSYSSIFYTQTELNAGQLNNLYYTETELNSGQLDNRYYTETELQGDGTAIVHWGNITNIDNATFDNVDINGNLDVSSSITFSGINDTGYTRYLTISSNGVLTTTAGTGPTLSLSDSSAAGGWLILGYPLYDYIWKANTPYIEEGCLFSYKTIDETIPITYYNNSAFHVIGFKISEYIGADAFFSVAVEDSDQASYGHIYRFGANGDTNDFIFGYKHDIYTKVDFSFDETIFRWFYDSKTLSIGTGAYQSSRIFLYDDTSSSWSFYIFNDDGGNEDNIAVKIRTGNANHDTGNHYYIQFTDYDDDTTGYIGVDDGTLLFFQVSDERLKSNISFSKINAMSLLSSIDLYEFNFRKSIKKTEVGYIAQKVNKVYPDMVNYNKKQDMWSVTPEKLIPVMHKALQEANDRISKLEQLVEQLINNK